MFSSRLSDFISFVTIVALVLWTLVATATISSSYILYGQKWNCSSYDYKEDFCVEYTYVGNSTK